MTTAKLLQQYLTFCESPLRGPEPIEVEFHRLLKHPEVTYVAFHKPHILMVGTKTIRIHWMGEDYIIGEFIFFLVRKRVGRVWETTFRFANITNTLDERYLDDTLHPTYLHPHIIVQDYKDIEILTGELCISSGQFEVYQALRKGHIDKVVELLFITLRTYGTGRPFIPIEYWPTSSSEGMSHDRHDTSQCHL
jgi:hypothetical protein